MKKVRSIISIVLVISVFFSLSACTCRHEFADATCVKPRTCVKCGLTEGEPLGHKWIEASCIAPKTCSVCGETEGEPKAHTPGEWAKLDESVIGGREVLKCLECGNIIETRMGDRTEKKEIKMVNVGGMPLTSTEFMYHLVTYLPEDSVVCTENKFNERTWFNDGSTFSVISSDYENDSRHIRFFYGDEYYFEGTPYKEHIDAYFDNAEDFTKIAPYVFQAVDPEFSKSDSFDEEMEIITQKLNNKETKEYYLKLNGWVFICHYTDNYTILGKTFPGYFEIRFITTKFFNETY